MRLLILVLATIAVLSLTHGGAQAGRGLPTADNPFCDVTTYTLRDLPGQAISTLESNGRPVNRSQLLGAGPDAGLWPLPHGA
jgi:hypothetical protein